MLLERFRVAYQSGDVTGFSNRELRLYLRYLKLMGLVWVKDYACVCCSGTIDGGIECDEPCKGDKCLMMRQLFCDRDNAYEEIAKLVQKESV